MRKECVNYSDIWEQLKEAMEEVKKNKSPSKKPSPGTQANLRFNNNNNEHNNNSNRNNNNGNAYHNKSNKSNNNNNGILNAGNVNNNGRVKNETPRYKLYGPNNNGNNNGRNGLQYMKKNAYTNHATIQVNYTNVRLLVERVHILMFPLANKRDVWVSSIVDTYKQLTNGHKSTAPVLCLVMYYTFINNKTPVPMSLIVTYMNEAMRMSISKVNNGTPVMMKKVTEYQKDKTIGAFFSKYSEYMVSVADFIPFTSRVFLKINDTQKINEAVTICKKAIKYGLFDQWKSPSENAVTVMLAVYYNDNTIPAHYFAGKTKKDLLTLKHIGETIITALATKNK